ncbi:hypothetical protein A9Q86_02215 [Flavobacteriales bacterium 33_180_T64]|nr:hypothetical protein A9Q86_02215 [Flavobacteriales bacterium 33_180_T64]
MGLRPVVFVKPDLPKSKSGSINVTHVRGGLRPVRTSEIDLNFPTYSEPRVIRHQVRKVTPALVKNLLPHVESLPIKTVGKANISTPLASTKNAAKEIEMQINKSKRNGFSFGWKAKVLKYGVPVLALLVIVVSVKYVFFNSNKSKSKLS